jgi:hypothetical protein|tara:strand:+ start:445 stop:621 length:177 start_codon:yes stop_codon:yes gene_type:complete
MKELHMFEEGNRMATVFARGAVSFRVWCFDSLINHQEEHYFNNEQAAEDFAENWVMKA